jgi:hypothetical protein
MPIPVQAPIACNLDRISNLSIEINNVICWLLVQQYPKLQSLHLSVYTQLVILEIRSYHKDIAGRSNEYEHEKTGHEYLAYITR